MSNIETYVKTEAGSDEVRARSRKLAPRMRTMLIMVDGTMSVSQLQDAAATLGAPGDFLQALQEQGLIRRREVAAAAERAVQPLAEPKTSTPSEATPAAISMAGKDEPELFRSARKFMNDTAVDALGLRAFFFTLKLEKCGNRADLRLLLADYDKLVTKASGEVAASVLSQRARELLS